MADTESQNKPVYVTISALDAGHITLPDKFFVAGADPDIRTTVPCLSFLIQHPSPPPSRAGTTTNLIFDLGVKRDISGYTTAQQPQVYDREPVITNPDCSASLRFGTNPSDTSPKEAQLLNPDTDIDYVILSHVHWDHIGTPSDFAKATFIVGSGTLDLLKNGAEPFNPAEEYNPDELPALRTVELPPSLRESRGDDNDDGDDDFEEYFAGSNTPVHTPTPVDSQAKLPECARLWAWGTLKQHHTHPRPHSHHQQKQKQKQVREQRQGFPRTIDFFGDQSVYIIDTPGHIYGHINLLVRTAKNKYVYLAGDSCHDIRIFEGEKEIAEYDDGRGGVRSIHVNTRLAKRTLGEIRAGVEALKGGGYGHGDEGDGEGVKVDVEVVLAHDGGWRERNMKRFWPGKM